MIKYRTINEGDIMKKYKDGTFITISDFHSYEWPLEKVKNII